MKTDQILNCQWAAQDGKCWVKHQAVFSNRRKTKRAGWGFGIVSRQSSESVTHLYHTLLVIVILWNRSAPVRTGGIPTTKDGRISNLKLRELRSPINHLHSNKIKTCWWGWNLSSCFFLRFLFLWRAHSLYLTTAMKNAPTHAACADCTVGIAKTDNGERSVDFSLPSIRLIWFSSAQPRERPPEREPFTFTCVSLPHPIWGHCCPPKKPASPT